MKILSVLGAILILAWNGATAQDSPESAEKRRLVIEIVDGDQQPLAGAPVVILASRQPGLQPWQGKTWGEQHEVVWRGRADEIGRITRMRTEILADVQKHLEWRFGNRYDDDQVWVALDIPGSPPGMTRVSLCSKAARGTTRISLTAPATGSLRFEVTGSKDARSPEGLIAELHWGDRKHPRVTALPVRDGSAIFTHVGTQASSRILVRDSKQVHRPSASATVAPPRRNRESAKTTIVHGLPYPVIIATLKDQEGRAISSTSFFWSVQNEDSFIDSGHVMSDAQGNVRFFVRRLPLPPARAPRVEMWPGVPSYRLQIMPPPTAKAVHALSPWPLASGPTSLGTIILEPVPR